MKHLGIVMSDGYYETACGFSSDFRPLIVDVKDEEDIKEELKKVTQDLSKVTCEKCKNTKYYKYNI